MNAGLRFLLVDDDEQKRSLLVHFLRRKFPSASMVECDNGQAAIDHLQASPVNVVVTDHSMCPVNGLELARWVRTHTPDLPLVMVTGHPDIEPEALEAGATLVVSFSRFAEIGEIVRGVLPPTAETPPTPPNSAT